MFVLAFVLVAVLWELYKAVGPADGGKVLGMRILPRTNDRTMPHVSEIFGRFGDPVTRGNDRTVFAAVVDATWYSLRTSLLAFVLGSLLGIGLAVLMARFKLVERALMPYLVISQTVPVIVLGPLIFSLMAFASRDLAGEPWIAAVAIGVFLAFFPVAMGMLRGLQSAPPAALELMDSYAAGWWSTMWKLRMPNAVPFLTPALRLAGAAAVVGVIVTEISLTITSGVGRLIFTYGQEASTDPPKLFTAVFGAAALGLIVAAIVAGIDRLLMRNHPPESA
jgi:NitT/TauT family transport system permease protein